MPDNARDAPNRWLSCLTMRGGRPAVDVMEALERENIESRPIWKPPHLQPFFSGCDYVGGDTRRGSLTTRLPAQRHKISEERAAENH
jgi:hypothetical protein